MEEASSYLEGKHDLSAMDQDQLFEHSQRVARSIEAINEVLQDGRCFADDASAFCFVCKKRHGVYDEV